MKKRFTHYGRNLLVLAAALLTCQTGYAQFTPGEGESLPTFTPFTEVPNKISGFFVRHSQRENNTFYTGTRNEVELNFPEPSAFGAETYTLQYSTDNGSHWNNYQYNGTDLTSNYNNFTLNFDAEYKLRLLVNGGPKNGYTSNEVYAPLSSIDTRFAGWGLDESFYLSGIMSPNIGRGILASFTVKKLSDDSAINGFLSYQWYRVNPVTFEMTAIPDSTNLSYTTTIADAGYQLLIKATGDGINVGGFVQLLVTSPNIVANRAFVSNITGSGFTLNLYKSVSGLTSEQLQFFDKDSNPVSINSVTQGSNAAIYNIAATLDVSKSPYYLTNVSGFWNIVTIMGEGQFVMSMPGVSIDFTTGIKTLKETDFNIYPIPAIDFVNFRLNCEVSHAEILSLNGQSIVKTLINNNEGKMNTSGLNNGIYLLRLVTSNGVMIKKFEVFR
ncbi:MAG: T9SS type A sorting domain-containing protein [Paludibacter sp.]|nr:T9SS type A sorting domain-containing protein [Paludibacter sp.]